MTIGIPLLTVEMEQNQIIVIVTNTMLKNFRKRFVERSSRICKFRHIMESNIDLGVVNDYDFLGVYNSNYYYRSQTENGWNDSKAMAASNGGWLAPLKLYKKILK